MKDLRIGQGFDVHEFASGRKLVLGGIEIPFERGLLGHSDADVLLHAITDALLGALSWGDIGSWFPDTDQAHKDRDSREFFSEVWAKVSADGWSVVNLDCTLLLQRPKIRPYVDSMRSAIAELLSLEVARVSLKATTTERLGFVGREEGVVASCVVLLSRE